MLNTRHYRNRLNFALVIEGVDYFRNSVIALLRQQGWLVHGVSRGEQAFSIMAHIPYNLIVLGSELPGISATDFVRILRNSREWQAIRLVVINNSEGANWAGQIADNGAFLARRSRWRDDLSGFLIADKGACGVRKLIKPANRSEDKSLFGLLLLIEQKICKHVPRDVQLVIKKLEAVNLLNRRRPTISKLSRYVE